MTDGTSLAGPGRGGGRRRPVRGGARRAGVRARRPAQRRRQRRRGAARRGGGARRGARARRARAPAASGSAPLAGVPFLVKDSQDLAGLPTRHGSLLLRGRAARGARRAERRAAAGGRRDPHRQDQRAGVLLRGLHRQPPLRRDAEPVGAAVVARRLQRRLRRRHGRRHGPLRDGHRRRRLRAHPRVVLRAVRAQAHHGPHRPRGRPGLAGLHHRRAAGAQHGRPAAAAAGPGRPRRRRPGLVAHARSCAGCSGRGPRRGRSVVLAAPRFTDWGPLPNAVADLFDAALTSLEKDLGLRVEPLAPAQIFGGLNVDEDWTAHRLVRTGVRVRRRGRGGEASRACTRRSSRR